MAKIGPDIELKEIGPREKRLAVLMIRYQRALTLRDSGIKARGVWREIKKIATSEEQVRVLESVHHLL